MNLEDITLSKLAVAGMLFNSLTPYNNSLTIFRSATGDSLDLANSEHRNALMKWLNAWGCRNLSKDQHQIASESILDWYQTYHGSLFSNRKPLWKLGDQELDIVAHAYGSLKDRIAARRFRHGKNSDVHIGATAASKILFAIMPKAIMPWDDAMRKSFNCDGSPLSYAKYLNMIKDITLRINTLCSDKGFHIDDLPKRIGRPDSTILELINAFIWVTETRKVQLPSSETLTQWASLG